MASNSFNFTKANKETPNENGWCFTEGSLVLMSNGEQKPIEDIEEGEQVIGKDGGVNTVIGTSQREAETLEVKVIGSPAFHITSDHPFATVFFDEKKVKTDESLSWSKQPAVSYVFTPEEEDFTAVGDIPTASSQNNHKGKLMVQMSNSSSLPYRKLSDAELSLYGFWLGDGSFNRKAKRITLYANDKKIEYIKGLGFDLEFKKYEYSTASGAELSKKSELYEKLLPIIETSAPTKGEKQLLSNFSKEEMKCILEGYSNADGYTREDGIVSSSTISRRLAVSLANAGRACGYFVSLNDYYQAETTVIEGRTVNQQPHIYTMQFNPEVSAVQKYANDKPYTSIKSKTEGGKRLVYNIDVDGDDTMIVDGVCVHNCQMWAERGFGYKGLYASAFSAYQAVKQKRGGTPPNDGNYYLIYFDGWFYGGRYGDVALYRNGKVWSGSNLKWRNANGTTLTEYKKWLGTPQLCWSEYLGSKKIATIPPKPAPKPSGKRVAQKGVFTALTAVNVRNTPSTKKNNPVAVYLKGQRFNYDSYIDAENIRWVSYISYSGKRRYVARRQLTGKKEVYGKVK